MILCIPSGRLLIADPCYLNADEVAHVAAGVTPDADIHEIRVPNTAIVESEEKHGHISRISLVFAQDGVGAPEVIAEIGVDTAQLMFADAAHVVAEWVEEEYQDIRIYRHSDGRTLQYRKDFPHFEAPIASEGDKTMNELNASGEWEQVKVDYGPYKVSYNGLCHCHDEEGIAMIGERVLVTETGGSDGCYELTRTMTKDGRIASLSMTFIGEDEEEDWDEEDWDEGEGGDE